MAKIQSLFFIVFLVWVLFSCQSEPEKARHKAKQEKEEYELQFRVAKNAGSVATLLAYYGEGLEKIDSARFDSQNTVKFIVPNTLPAGMYRLSFGKRRFLNFIFNREDVSLKTHANYPVDSMEVLVSQENQLLYGYMHRTQAVESKVRLLIPLLMQYPQDSEFYSQIQEEYGSITSAYQDFFNEMQEIFPETFATKYLRFAHNEFPHPHLNDREQRLYLQEHFLDNADFTDTILLRSDVIPQKIITYLSFFRNQEFSPDKQSELFITAIDRILERAAADQTMFEFAVQYLIKGFEKYKYEKVLIHLGEKYVPEISCVNENLKTDMQERIARFNRVSAGKKAPDFELTSSEGNKISLSRIDSEYTLVVFWASWCPHCENLLEKLRKFKQKHKDRVQIIAISVDENAQDYEKALAEHNYPWTNCAELNGWEGKTVEAYNVYATPMLFLLDRQKQIVGKPLSIEKLQTLID